MARTAAHPKAGKKRHKVQIASTANSAITKMRPSNWRENVLAISGRIQFRKSVLRHLRGPRKSAATRDDGNSIKADAVGLMAKGELWRERFSCPATST